MERQNIGSWFFISLHEVVTQYHHNHDLLSLLNLVNGNTVKNFSMNSSDPDEEGTKVIPWIASMLTKNIFFHTHTKKKNELD